nr:PREDICTED: uncharacterized protein LOC109030097 [Bemisia tabaci]
MWKISRGFKEFSDRIDRLIALQSECLHFNKSKKQCKAVTGQIQDFDPDKLKKQHKCCLAKYFESHVPKQFCSTLSSHFRKNRQEKADNSWEDLHLKHPHAWLGAVGWSGALVLGWYAWQPFLRWGCHYDSETQRQQHEDRYVTLFKLIRNVAFAQPISVRSILPALPQTDSSVNLVEYGPISAEQALEDAAEALVKVRADIMAEVEHQHGMECIEQKHYRRAVKHFQEASKFNYAPAAYNLALCYERGLGTSQDFKMAAHWYQQASDWGHAGAMYNLGVFHAHGWGGVKADPEVARRFLASAAALGQPDAISALKLESEECPINLKLSPNPSPSAEKIRKISNTIQSFAFSPHVSKSSSLHDAAKKLSFSSTSEFGSDASHSSNGKDSGSGSIPVTPLWTDSGCSSAEQEPSVTEYYAGMCYENGWGVDENLPMAAEFYSKAALSGNAEALYNLAVYYEGSTGDSQDLQLTMQLYRMAADHGSVAAGERLKTLETYESLGILNEVMKDSSQQSKLTKKPLIPF